MCKAWEFRDARSFEVSRLARPKRPWSPGVGKGFCLPLTRSKVRGGFLGAPKRVRLRAAPQILQTPPAIEIVQVYPLAVETWKMMLGRKAQARGTKSNLKYPREVL